MSYIDIYCQKCGKFMGMVEYEKNPGHLNNFCPKCWRMKKGISNMKKLFNRIKKWFSRNRREKFPLEPPPNRPKPVPPKKWESPYIKDKSWDGRYIHLEGGKKWKK